MELSDHDLRQIDERYLDELPETELREVSKKLCRELKAARERLNQTPKNSSRPSSTQAPWESVSPESEPDRKTKSNDSSTGSSSTKPKKPPEHPVTEQTDSPPARKPGRQPGAQGYGRTTTLPVTEHRIHKPSHCAACNRRLDEHTDFVGFTARYELELDIGKPEQPGLRVRHIKHAYYQAGCSCGHQTRAEPGRCDDEAQWSVKLSEWRLCGPRLASLIVCMTFHLRVSRRNIQAFFADWLHIDLSPGTINACIHELGRAVEPVVQDQLLPELVNSPQMCVDETPWKEGMQLLWLWVFQSATTVVFCIGKRNRALFLRILGEKFEGILMSDGFSVYRDYSNRLRCWAHLVRKARGLAQSLDVEAQEFGETILLALYLLMHNIYRLRDGPPPAEAEEIHRQNEILRTMLQKCCTLYQDHPQEKVGRLAREFLYDWNVIMRVVDEPHLPLTNNAAESALRPWVILRKLTSGSRNTQGSRVVALLASVIGTCRLRALNPWEYLAEVLEQRRKGLPAPIMPITVGISG